MCRIAVSRKAAKSQRKAQRVQLKVESSESTKMIIAERVNICRYARPCVFVLPIFASPFQDSQVTWFSYNHFTPTESL